MYPAKLDQEPLLTKNISGRCRVKVIAAAFDPCSEKMFSSLRYHGIVYYILKEVIIVKVEKAGIDDIDALVRMRLDYLNEDNGGLNASDVTKIRRDLPDYYKSHINKDLFIYVIRENLSIVACAFLLVIEKPMSPSFINGRTATILNVYTCPAKRHKGYARMIMEALLEEAKKLQLSVVDLKSTDDGYHLYKSVGFEDDSSKYHLMKWKPNSLTQE